MDIELSDFKDRFPQNQSSIQFEQSFQDGLKGLYCQSQKKNLLFNKNKSNKLSNSKQQQMSIPLKKSNKIKNRIRKHQNQQYFVKQILNIENDLQISPGLTLNNQGILKFGFSIGHVSFGYQQTQFIKYLQNDQIFQNHLFDAQKAPKISVEQALQYILHTPCKEIQQVREALVYYKDVQQFLYKAIESVEINQQLIQFQNEEFQKHIESCNEYIKTYVKANEGQMFQYSIGRVNFLKKGVEFVQTGYSKSFLDLIGVNEQSLTSLLLRNQKIELIKDQDEIMRISLIGLTKHSQSLKELKTSFKINTFDGFNILLHQTKKQISPAYQAKKLCYLPFEYIFSISVFDVELEDLKNLINYRQKIYSKKTYLTYDEFINKELSLLFEHVEYSVLSQQFIEKFYNDNLKQLEILEEIKKKNEIRCGHKAVQLSSGQSTQVQVIYK
ncbi:hypothetical protein ABPG74_008010 [Tetrahymena malaccensis]